MLLQTTDNNKIENDPYRYFCITNFQNHTFMNTEVCTTDSVIWPPAVQQLCSVHLIFISSRQKCTNKQHFNANKQSFCCAVWKLRIWQLCQYFSLTSAQRALLTVSDMLVSWGLIKNRDTGSPLQCYLQTGSGPVQCLLHTALWTLLLQHAQHLPVSIAQDSEWVEFQQFQFWGYDTMYSETWTVCCFNLHTFLLVQAQLPYNQHWIFPEYMSVLPTEFLQYIFKLTCAALHWKWGRKIISLLRFFKLYTLDTLCTVQ